MEGIGAQGSKTPGKNQNQRQQKKTTLGIGQGQQRAEDKSQNRPIKIFYTNARSILNKFDQINILIEDDQPDILLFTETWCILYKGK